MIDCPKELNRTKWTSAILVDRNRPSLTLNPIGLGLRWCQAAGNKNNTKKPKDCVCLPTFRLLVDENDAGGVNLTTSTVLRLAR